MKNEWEDLLNQIKKNISFNNIDENYFKNYYQILKLHYTDPKRFYHTFNHIKTLLDSLYDFHITNIEKIKIELAIWFHDIIYDPKQKNNEEVSSREFTFFGIEVGLDFDLIEEIVNMIIATKHDDSAKTRLEKIMCDIDLKQLAFPEYIQNSNNVKKEFAHLTNKEWKKGRSNFLKTFINKEFIYYTNEYRGALEDTARINLQKELNYINTL